VDQEYLAHLVDQPDLEDLPLQLALVLLGYLEDQLDLEHQ
jgi:hypothetical protein